MVDDQPAADAVAGFAADLRALRLSADSPTLARLQHDTGISRTVLSNAFGGKHLPSARTVDRLVRACGGDPAPWVRRRDELAGLHGPVVSEQAAGAAAEADPEASADRPSPVGATAGETAGPTADATAGPTTGATAPRAARAGMRRTTAAVLIAAAFVVGSGVSAGVGAAVTSATIEQVRAEAKAEARKELAVAPVNPRAQINVHNGVDPAMTPCVNDAEVATSSPRTNNTLIEIIWSNKCYAGWGRVTRYDEQVSGNSIMVAIYPETAPQGSDRQEATEPDVQGAYTTLVVRPTPQTRLCAVGAITLDGESIDLGEPLCI